MNQGEVDFLSEKAVKMIENSLIRIEENNKMAKEEADDDDEELDEDDVAQLVKEDN